MWSGPEAARGVATTSPEPRRGHVWLVQIPAERTQRAVLLLSRDRDGAAADPLIAAPLVSGAAASGRISVEIPGGVERAVIDVRRLMALDPSALVQPIAALTQPRLAEIDQALCDVLGLDLPAWPSADELERRLRAGADVPEEPDSAADRLVELPAAAPMPAHNGDRLEPAPLQEPPDFAEAASFVPATSFDQLGFGPPPAPPPLVDIVAAPPDDPTVKGDASGSGLDDHPIAQLFGRRRPTTNGTATLRKSAAPGAPPVRTADVMPELLDIVERRLHRSAPRLEAVLSQAAEEGRSVDWAAAAVRHASVRGVMQSTLDEIAAEIAAVGARARSAL